jgi:hypothetical protein
MPLPRYHYLNKRSLPKCIKSKSILANVYDACKNDFLFDDNYGIKLKEEKTLKPLKIIPKISKFYSKTNDFFKIISEIDFKILAENHSTEEILASTLKLTLNDKINNYEFVLFKKQTLLLLKEIRKITKKMRIQDGNTRKSLEWKYAGYVIDRLCLYLFTVITITSTCALLITSPNFFKLR